ncbi:PLD nuclease N-terminal domain-containing protein [Microbacterium indicum]|uniref:PLD nuclease N-terminal domain-containing protein n=1 Tax=Microbacterium indicum TaxID=358100 RepID=UPI00040C3BFD|nr:PLD nuclease N-terminal domain-containing protein [Microbacterium indicum]
MARLLILLAVAAAVFTVFCIVDCAVQPESRHRGAPKGVWVVITLVPVIGGILWLTIGRSRGGQAQQPASPVLAPDDDPSFLAASDERIRRLEEEIAMLDAEERFQSESFDPEKPSGDEPDDEGDGPRGVGA